MTAPSTRAFLIETCLDGLSGHTRQGTKQGWLSAVMGGRKWEALGKPRIIDQWIHSSVSWAGNKLPGVSNIAVSRLKAHFCDLCRGEHNLLTKQYRIFSQWLAPDIFWLFTARIFLVSFLFTNITPFGIHQVTSACWKLIQPRVGVTLRCQTLLTLTLSWISASHRCTEHCTPAGTHLAPDPTGCTVLLLGGTHCSEQCLLYISTVVSTKSEATLSANSTKHHKQVICGLVSYRRTGEGTGTHLQTSAHGHTLIPHQSTKQPSACLHLHKLQNVAKISFTSRHVICKAVYACEEVARQPQPQIPAIKARAFSKTRRWYPTYPHVNAEELPYAVSQCGWFGIGAARLPHKHSPPSAQQSCSSTARSAAAQSTGCSAGTEAAPTRQRLHMRQTKNNYGSWEAGRDPSGAAINSTKRLPEPQWIQQWNPPHQESALNFIVLKLHCTSKAKFNKSSTFWQKLTDMEQVSPNSP